VLPQLASRVSHPFNLVTDMLAALIGKVLLDYPQQAIWTMVGQLNSTVADRRRRIQLIVDRAKSSASRRVVVPGVTFTLADIERVLQGLVKQLLHVANYETQDMKSLSMKNNFPALRAMLPCKIIMPFQSSMTVTLPTDPTTVLSHNPFPQELITFKGSKL
jgi:serine/threonine-protein kinase ATR